VGEKVGLRGLNIGNYQNAVTPDLPFDNPEMSQSDLEGQIGR